MKKDRTSEEKTRKKDSVAQSTSDMTSVMHEVDASIVSDRCSVDVAVLVLVVVAAADPAIAVHDTGSLADECIGSCEAGSWRGRSAIEVVDVLQASLLAKGRR